MNKLHLFSYGYVMVMFDPLKSYNFTRLTHKENEYSISS